MIVHLHETIHIASNSVLALGHGRSLSWRKNNIEVDNSKRLSDDDLTSSQDLPNLTSSVAFIQSFSELQRRFWEQ
jgi:hypothetical protein